MKILYKEKDIYKSKYEILKQFYDEITSLGEIVEVIEDDYGFSYNIHQFFDEDSIEKIDEMLKNEIDFSFNNFINMSKIINKNQIDEPEYIGTVVTPIETLEVDYF